MPAHPAVFDQTKNATSSPPPRPSCPSLQMYYNMRIKTLKRNTTNVVRKAQESKQVRTSHINLNLNVLLRQTKDIQRKIESQKWLGSAAWPAQTAASEAAEDSSEQEEKALTDEEMDQFRQKYQALHNGIDEKQREILETKQQFEAFRYVSHDRVAQFLLFFTQPPNPRTTQETIV